MKQKYDKKIKSKIITLLKFAILLAFIIAFIFAIFLFYQYNKLELNKSLLEEISTPALVFNNKNELIDNNVQGVPYIKLDDLNSYTKNAFICIEDKNFYKHNGIDAKRIIGATIKNITSGKIKEGASTITQQLIKNTHLTNEKTYNRKMKEIILSLKIEKLYSKNDILEMYLNAIYFGNGCYGIESASQFYFNKSAKELNINESAILAGIIKSPKYYSPLVYEDNIIKRKNLILSEMYKDNAININDLNENKTKLLELNINKMDYEKQSSYINSALLESSNILNLPINQIIKNKYKIYTYYEDDISRYLIDSVRHNTNAMHNAIVVDNLTGGIIAFNSNYTYDGIQKLRTPASTIKPVLVYAPALESGEIYPCSFLDDNPTTYDNEYTPKNISNKYYGKISAEDALAKSLNIPAINLFKKMGIEKCKSFAKKCGIKFDKTDNGLSLALGSMKYGITIQDLVNAYSPFVNNGKFKQSTFIKKIEDENGKVIYSHDTTEKQVMSEETSYLTAKMLGKAVKNGTCSALSSLPFEVHAKSGTNGSNNENYNTDTLCIAQTTKHTACIWYFSKDYKEENLLENLSKSQLSPTIKIKNLFELIYTNNKPKNFEKPKGIVTLKLDAISYRSNLIELASTATPERYTIEKEFNIKYTPKNLSTNFIIIKTPLFLNETTNEITLSFTPSKNQNYELIKEYIENGVIINTTLLSLNNSNELTTFTDNDLKNGINYSYYLKISNIEQSTTYYSNIINYSKQDTTKSDKTNKNNSLFFYFN